MIPDFVAWLLTNFYNYVGDAQNNTYRYEQTFQSLCETLGWIIPTLTLCALFWLVKGIFKKGE